MRIRLLLPVAAFVLAEPIVAQTVTLPTIRTNKSIEFTMLTRAIDDIKKERSSLTRLNRADSVSARNELLCDVALLSLSPYTDTEFEQAIGNKQEGNQKQQASRAVVALSQKGRRSANNAPPEHLIETLDNAPEKCRLEPPSESLVREIMRKYIDAEENIALHARLDTLARVALANVIQSKLRKKRWFPVGSHDHAMAFWRQSASSSLNVGAISGSNEEGATFTEISSRFLHAVRLSFNAVLSSARDTTAKTSAAGTTTASDTGKSLSAIARFLNGGGLFNIAAAFPAYHVGTTNGAADFIVLIAPRFGGTLPILGATARDTTLMYDVGTELFFKSADYVDGIGFFVQSRIAMAGGSNRFMTLIGDPGRKRTAYQTMSFGLSFDDKYLITISRVIAGPSSLQNGWQIGTTLARSAAPATASTP